MELPNDLGALYKVMIYQIEPLCWQQAAKIFKVFGVLMNARDSNVSPLELDIAVTASQDETLSTMIAPMQAQEILSRCERIDAHLKSRCAGLLELSGRLGGSGLYWNAKENRFEGGQKSLRVLLSVDYLHRTVQEFLETEDVQSILSSDTAAIPDFEPHKSVFMTYIIRLKRFLYPTNDSLEYPHGPWEGDIPRAVYSALEYAGLAESSGSKDYTLLLDELESTMNHFWSGTRVDWYREVLLAGTKPPPQSRTCPAPRLLSIGSPRTASGYFRYLMQAPYFYSGRSSPKLATFYDTKPCHSQPRDDADSLSFYIPTLLLPTLYFL